MISIVYKGKDRRGEIRDAKDGRVNFAVDIEYPSIEFSPDGKLVSVYNSRKMEIRDAKDGRVIFAVDIECPRIKFSPDGKLISIIYNKDRKGEIRDAKDGRVIFAVDIEYPRIEFSPDGERALIHYNDRKNELIDLNHNQSIDFIKFSPEQLLFVFKLNRNPHYLDNMQDNDQRHRVWQSFVFEIQQILKESYFPKVTPLEQSYIDLYSKLAPVLQSKQG